MNDARTFAQAVAETERVLVAALGLRPLAVPPELARLEGSWRGTPAVMDVRAYAGPRTAYARFAELSGTDLAIGNVLCLATAAYALPIFGADLVALAKDTVVAVADLSPVPGAAQNPEFSAIVGADALLELPRSEPPAWAASWLSSSALVTRAPASAAPVIARALASYCRVYVELAEAAAPDAGRRAAVVEAHAAYARAHVLDDRGLNLLGKIFEPGLAGRFVREVLFPERTPAWN